MILNTLILPIAGFLTGTTLVEPAVYAFYLHLSVFADSHYIGTGPSFVGLQNLND